MNDKDIKIRQINSIRIDNGRITEPFKGNRIIIDDVINGIVVKTGWRKKEGIENGCQYVFKGPNDINEMINFIVSLYKKYMPDSKDAESVINDRSTH